MAAHRSWQRTTLTPGSHPLGAAPLACCCLLPLLACGAAPGVGEGRAAPTLAGERTVGLGRPPGAILAASKHTALRLKPPPPFKASPLKPPPPYEAPPLKTPSFEESPLKPPPPFKAPPLQVLPPVKPPPPVTMPPLKVLPSVAAFPSQPSLPPVPPPESPSPPEATTLQALSPPEPAGGAEDAMAQDDPTCERRIASPADGLFGFGRGELLPEAAAALEAIAPLLQGDPPPKVTIEGHTDAVGSEAYNQQLSERRAESVRNWLVGQGYLASAAIVGHGETRPVAPNARADGSDHPEGRGRNRRVEIVLDGCG